MKNLPQGFISTLLAQKKLSGNGNSNNSNNATVSDDYSFNPRLSDKPSFHTPNIRDDEDFPHVGIIKALADGLGQNFAVSGFNATNISATSVDIADGKIFRDGKLNIS